MLEAMSTQMADDNPEYGKRFWAKRIESALAAKPGWTRPLELYVLWITQLFFSTLTCWLGTSSRPDPRTVSTSGSTR